MLFPEIAVKTRVVKGVVNNFFMFSRLIYNTKMNNNRSLYKVSCLIKNRFSLLLTL
jgi:hypothetical protein